ncbi:hypothetical protein Tco_0536524 [Tanacetum coccineum]
MEEHKESDEVEEVSEDDEGELMKHLVIKKDEVDKSRWKFQEIFFNDKDAIRNRQRRLGGSLEDSKDKFWSIAEYGVSTSIGYGISSSWSNTVYSLKLINTAYPLPLDRAYRLSGTEAAILCMTRSSTDELFTHYKEPEQEFRSSRRHFKTLTLDELRSPDFNLLSDQE